MSGPKLENKSDKKIIYLVLELGTYMMYGQGLTQSAYCSEKLLEYWKPERALKVSGQDLERCSYVWMMEENHHGLSFPL